MAMNTGKGLRRVLEGSHVDGAVSEGPSGFEELQSMGVAIQALLQSHSLTTDTLCPPGRLQHH